MYKAVDFVKNLFSILLLPIAAYKIFFEKRKKLFFLSHFILLFFISLYSYFSIYKQIPPVEKLLNYEPSLETQFFDRNGALIYSVSEEKRIYTPINEIPKNLINAFISAEDKTFFTNPGFDALGITRAAILSVPDFIRGKRIGGASTITQQVVKNILLTKERTLKRKIQEFILSYKITKILTKEKILEIYLNHIYLGNKSYGIGVAAKNYFDKDLKSLSIGECAFLASLPKAPSIQNKERLIGRRNWILSQMRDLNFISESDYEEQVKTDLIFQKQSTLNKNETGRLASWFARKNTIDFLGTEEDDFKRSGYKIYTTLDKNIQEIVQNSLDKNLIQAEMKYNTLQIISSEPTVNLENWQKILKTVQKPENLGNLTLGIVLEVQTNNVKVGLQKYGEIREFSIKELLWAFKKDTKHDIKNILKAGDVVAIFSENLNEKNIDQIVSIPTLNGAVVAINPKTGEIIAMSGGYLDIPGNLNRSVDAIRQTGSSIKPFIYATALENGKNPSSIFMDSNLEFSSGDGFVWQPKNHDYSTNGPVTLRYGLEKSLNSVTIRIIEKIGIAKVVNLLKKLNIAEKVDPEFAVGLGTLHSSLLGMTRAYSIFVNDGILPDINLIKTIKDKTNTKINQKPIYLNNFNFSVEKMKSDEQLETEKKENESTIIENIEKNDNSMEEHKAETSDKNIISKETAYQIFSMLQGSVLHGTSSKAAILGLPIGGKTGTSDLGKDLWFFGVSPEIVIGIYIGADLPKETDMYGATVPLPIYIDIMKELRNKIKITNLKPPVNMIIKKINRKTGKIVDTGVIGGEIIYENYKTTDKIEIEESNEDKNNTKDDLF